ncbi:MAG: hypothetical protein AAFR98_00400 [Pseudomonadota bacterium]
MTALEEYSRLEATGLWKTASQAQRREVIVSFGTATLVLSDINEMPLTHWSLAAVERLGSKVPAIYFVAGDEEETLEIADPAMVDAIERIRLPLRPQEPHSGSLRLGLFLASILSAALAIWLWMPNALANYGARIIPAAKEQEIGNNLLGYVERFTGRSCSSEAANQALARLHARVLPGQRGSLRIAELGAQAALHLPGGITMLHIAVIEEFSGPAVVSGYVLREDIFRRSTDPIADFLKSAGLGSTIWFLTTGELSEDVYEDYARNKITSLQSPPTTQQLLQRFDIAEIPSTPFAYALDPSGVTTKELIDNDPVPQPEEPLISETDWLAIQAVCDPT